MDLRPYNLSAAQIERAKAVLAYQPFILSGGVCTGVAYDWLFSDAPERRARREIYEAASDGPAIFRKAFEANSKLIRTYETFARTICGAFPGGTYLDVSCNTGWFPVFASLNGMRRSVGVDPGDYAPSVAFLNEICGSGAEFMSGGYRSHPKPEIVARSADGYTPMTDQFDVVSNLEFLCHLGDPLHFLHALAAVARKGVFLWSGFLESSEYLIRLNEPSDAPMMGTVGVWGHYCYGTAISTQLLFHTMGLLGFPFRLEVSYPPDGLPEDWHLARMAQYQKHRAFLFVREPYVSEVRDRLSPV
jgi:SAM-dependent methyltransferase